MSCLWSKTSTAVNNGYGRIGLPNPSYRPLPYAMPVLPDLSYNPSRRYTKASGGNSLQKGSEEAKKRMAYLRSLRGTKRAGKKSIRGGEGIGEFFSTFFQSLGGTAMNAIKRLALDTGASITELLADPSSLIKNLMTFAPAAARAVKNFFLGRKRGKTTPRRKKSPSDEKQEYLRLLKKYNPELYKKKMRSLKRLQEMAKSKYELKRLKELEMVNKDNLYDEDDDDNDDQMDVSPLYDEDDDDDDDIPPPTPPRRKPTPSRRRIGI